MVWGASVMSTWYKSVEEWLQPLGKQNAWEMQTMVLSTRRIGSFTHCVKVLGGLGTGCGIVHHTIHSFNDTGVFAKPTSIANFWRGLVTLLIRLWAITSMIIRTMRGPIGGRCSIATTIMISILQFVGKTRGMALIINNIDDIGGSESKCPWKKFLRLSKVFSNEIFM